MRRLGIAGIALRAGLSERGLRKSLDPRTTPRIRTTHAVLHAAAEAVRDQLGLRWNDDLRVIVAYTQLSRACQRCGKMLPAEADPRRKYCESPCESHRVDPM